MNTNNAINIHDPSNKSQLNSQTRVLLSRTSKQVKNNISINLKFTNFTCHKKKSFKCNASLSQRSLKA